MNDTLKKVYCSTMLGQVKLNVLKIGNGLIDNSLKQIDRSGLLSITKLERRYQRNGFLLNIAKRKVRILCLERKYEMVTIEEMKNAVGHNVIVYFTDGSPEKAYVESYEYEPDEDKEPFILFTHNRADYQSSIERIEIID